ncbi:MAG: hypothetical protein JNK21_11350 [Rhodospirillaceae bacterium]|nr:hypothetical protein [Rhodospirillaceae bacterium]
MTTALPATLATTGVADPVQALGAGTQQPLPDLQACIGEFLRRIVPNTAAYMAARAAATRIAADLRAELYREPQPNTAESDHMVAGSVGKLTAIAPITTVDLLFVLPPKLGISKPGDALKTAWAVLKSKHAGARISDDQTAVLVNDSDATARVLPCLPREGAFLVPGPDQWSLSNPIAEAATLRLMDTMYGNRPRLLMAVLKAWRLHNAVPISAYALELLAQDFYSSAPRPQDIATALADFWAWAKKRTPATLKTPGASTAVTVDAAWHGKAKAAYWRVTLAQSHVMQKKMADAAKEWRELVGPLFPLPGETVGALPAHSENPGSA